LNEEGKFSASVFWRDVVEYGATWYTAVPTMHQILLSRADQDKDWISKNRLRFIRSCSSSLAPAVLESLEKVTGRPVLEAYAMTEAAHQMTSNPLPKHGPHKPGSVGRATNVQLKIEGSGDQPFKIGEVCIRGNNVTVGYVNRPEANAEAFDADGWFRTGDLGYLDEYGYLFLSGRIKEIVNRGGEKISPPEIDAALLEMPGIGEAVSFGMPSSKYGEELYAAVVKSSAFKGELKEEDILKFCASRLARVKVPTKIFIVSQIPKSATGKIQRKNLSSHFAKELQSKQSKL
jgi:acyl-CoA synthetase (AMP-forming)/AMP-acid ligase II